MGAVAGRNGSRHKGRSDIKKLDERRVKRIGREDETRIAGPARFGIEIPGSGTTRKGQIRVWKMESSQKNKERKRKEERN